MQQPCADVPPLETTPLLLVAPLLPPLARCASMDAVRTLRSSANGDEKGDGAAADGNPAAVPFCSGDCPVASRCSRRCIGMPAMASGLSGGGSITGTDSGRPSVCWLYGTDASDLPPVAAASCRCAGDAEGTAGVAFAGGNAPSSTVFAPPPKQPP